MNQKGFTIIELLIIITVLSFGILGVYNAFYPAVALTREMSSRLTATYLAQEGIEVVRSIRDSNIVKKSSDQKMTFASLLDQCSVGCQLDYKTGTLFEASADRLQAFDPGLLLRQDVDGFYSYSDGVKTPFSRKVTISQSSGKDTLRAQVVVSWSENGKLRSVSKEAYFYNWK
jgi:type II secretory pathway pseudopilin PulG